MTAVLWAAVVLSATSVDRAWEARAVEARGRLASPLTGCGRGLELAMAQHVRYGGHTSIVLHTINVRDPVTGALFMLSFGYGPGSKRPILAVESLPPGWFVLTPTGLPFALDVMAGPCNFRFRATSPLRPVLLPDRAPAQEKPVKREPEKLPYQRWRPRLSMSLPDYSMRSANASNA